MIRSRKMLLWLGASIFVISCIAIFLNCFGPETNPKTKLQDLYFTTEVTGWVPDSSSHFVQYPAESLYNFINGPAQRYIDSGLVSWFREKMNGGPTASPDSGDYVFNGYIHDYGTTAKAKALYEAKVVVNVTPYPTKKVVLDQYSDNEAQAITVGGGIQVYATFGKFYFEFNITGFQVSGDAVPEALKFLDKYKATVH